MHAEFVRHLSFISTVCALGTLSFGSLASSKVWNRNVLNENFRISPYSMQKRFQLSHWLPGVLNSQDIEKFQLIQRSSVGFSRFFATHYEFPPIILSPNRQHIPVTKTQWMHGPGEGDTKRSLWAHQEGPLSSSSEIKKRWKELGSRGQFRHMRLTQRFKGYYLMLTGCSDTQHSPESGGHREVQCPLTPQFPEVTKYYSYYKCQRLVLRTGIGSVSGESEIILLLSIIKTKITEYRGKMVTRKCLQCKFPGSREGGVDFSSSHKKCPSFLELACMTLKHKLQIQLN